MLVPGFLAVLEEGEDVGREESAGLVEVFRPAFLVAFGSEESGFYGGFEIRFGVAGHGMAPWL